MVRGHLGAGLPPISCQFTDCQDVRVPWGDVLRAQMARPPGSSPGLLSRLSGVPQATIVNWLEGRVARPRRWEDLVRVGDAMRLGRDEVDELLAAARHPPVVELARSADAAGRALPR
ncbi:MAG: hypothetical protein M3499_05255 [Actinomycetota bacterium]|nr:hypothetical protein [Actinomycetota bacterium]